MKDFFSFDIFEEIGQSLAEALSDATDPQMIEDLRVMYLGKKGYITDLLKTMKTLSLDEKKTFGQMVNELKQASADSIAKRAEELKALEIQNEIDSMPEFDLTIPTKEDRGSYHPITLVQRECERIFTAMGFNVEDYPEVVTDYECFEAVNVPKDHPARDMQDTYYLENGELLKSQTSAAQNAILRKYGKQLKEQGMPIRAIFPADASVMKRPTRPTRTPSSRWRV